jgi:hypothetical protein
MSTDEQHVTKTAAQGAVAVTVIIVILGLIVFTGWIIGLVRMGKYCKNNIGSNVWFILALVLGIFVPPVGQVIGIIGLFNPSLGCV